MPLKRGKSKKTISANIKELMKKTPSKARSKAIGTLAKSTGESRADARRRQAVAIALSAAGKSRTPRKKKK